MVWNKKFEIWWNYNLHCQLTLLILYSSVRVVFLEKCCTFFKFQNCTKSTKNKRKIGFSKKKKMYIIMLKYISCDKTKIKNLTVYV